MSMDEIRPRYPEYQALAEQGDREGQYWSGYCRFHGQGVEEDWTLAIEMMKRAAAQRSGKAGYQLGFCFETGKGVEQDLEESQRWYQESIAYLKAEAHRGESESLGLLGHAYSMGNGVPLDMKEAMRLYHLSIEQNNTIAQNLLGSAYQEGHGVEKDMKKAVEWYSKSAFQGEAAAQNELGCAFLNGEGVDEKNNDKAFHWFKKSAEHGYPGAQCNLGWCYESGTGVRKSLETAVFWYTKAAAKGDTVALNNLGCCYQNGSGVEMDLPRALELFTKAAASKQNNSSAQNNLGWTYEKGLAVNMDYIQAAEWYQKSMNQGNTAAQGNFERLLTKLQTAAHECDRVVLKALSHCYKNGIGVEADQDLAQAWLLQSPPLTMEEDDQEEDTESTVDSQESGATLPASMPLSRRELSSAVTKCVCCEAQRPSAMLVHGDTGHACCCLGCAYACHEGGCPLCRVAVDKIVLELLPPDGQQQSKCMICMKDASIANTMLVHGGTGHTVCCLPCAKQAKERGDPCPACPKSIDRVVVRFNL